MPSGLFSNAVSSMLFSIPRAQEGSITQKSRPKKIFLIDYLKKLY